MIQHGSPKKTCEPFEAKARLSRKYKRKQLQVATK